MRRLAYPSGPLKRGSTAASARMTPTDFRNSLIFLTALVEHQHEAVPARHTPNSPADRVSLLERLKPSK